MKIEHICALEKIKKLKDNSQDIIFADPPYALGSTVLIGKDGKPFYKKATDFMNKWEMPDEKFWEEFFIEANRVLKYGGMVLFFGIDRQLMLFQYYGIASGLEIKQSLYWYSMNSFPKAADLSKNIDKRLKTERKIIGYDEEKAKKMANSAFGSGVYKENGFNNNNMSVDGACIITSSNTELGQKYEGFKYSLSPLKQVLETVMVFQNPTKNKSVLDDVFAFEKGDNTISPSIWNINNSRVPTTDSLNGGATSSNNGVIKKDGFERPWMNDKEKMEAHKEKMIHKVKFAEENGRFPSQLFIDEENKSYIDTQGGESSKDVSKILHSIAYFDEELDLLIYSSKVSKKERNAGLENFEEQEREHRGNNQGTRVCVDCLKTDNGTNNHENCKGEYSYKLCKPLKNTHPTLKPIKLIFNIAKLLKSPNKQNVFFPFCGTGSEIIGFIKAGFDKELFECSEIKEEYIEISYARIKYWEEIDFKQQIKE